MNEHKKIEKTILDRFDAGIGPDSIVYAKLLKEYIDKKFEDLYDRLERTLIFHDLTTSYIPTVDEG